MSTKPVKVKAEITGLAAPSRRTVEALFRELSHVRWGDHGDGEYNLLTEELRKLKDRLTDTPEVRDLELRIDTLNEKTNRERMEKEEKVRNVRQKYFAHGLTPAVVKDIQKLVEEIG